MQFIKLNFNYKAPLNREFTRIYERAGSLWAVVSLPVTGFISGQAIPIKMNVVNDSNVQIDRIKIILMRKEEYTYIKCGERKQKSSSKKLTELVLDDGVDAKSLRNIEKPLVVPPLVPACSIPDAVTWCYELKVKKHVMLHA